MHSEPKTPSEDELARTYVEHLGPITLGTEFARQQEARRGMAKVKADAVREALSDLGDQADEPTVVVGDEEDESTWVDLTLREWLTIRADRIEREA